MAGTNAVAAKAALRTLLAAAPGFVGVQVAYSAPRDMAKESVWALDDIGGPVTLAAFQGGTGVALKRQEDLSGAWVIHVRGDGRTVEANETRAAALGAVFEGVVATNPTLGVAGLKLAQISSFAMVSAPDDEGVTTQITYTIGYLSENQ